jgi:hypothetical protein
VAQVVKIAEKTADAVSADPWAAVKGKLGPAAQRLAIAAAQQGIFGKGMQSRMNAELAAFGRTSKPQLAAFASTSKPQQEQLKKGLSA